MNSTKAVVDNLDLRLSAHQTGVYVITCVPTAKQYVGSTIMGMPKRWAQHRSALRRGCHGCPHLQNAWKKHGEAAFRFEVLEYCTADDCLAREQHWLDLLHPAFNSRLTAASNRGMAMTTEGRQKISDSALARDPSCWRRGEKHPRAQLTEEQARHVLDLYARGLRQAEIMRITGISRVRVHNMVTGKRWKHLQSKSPIRRQETRGLAGEQSHEAKLTIISIVSMLERYAEGAKVKEMAAALGVDPVTLYAIIRGKTWNGVSAQIDLVREQAVRSRRSR